MSQETFLLARLTLELREAQDELRRLGAERLRLARKTELLTSTLYELRAEHALPEQALLRIEEALAFDGQPWADEQPDESEEEELEGYEPLPVEPDDTELSPEAAPESRS
jgi:hypothetical protein